MKKKIKYEKVLKSNLSYHTDRRRSQKFLELKFVLISAVVCAVIIVLASIAAIAVNWHYFLQSTTVENSTITESSALTTQEKDEKLLTLVNAATALSSSYALMLESYNSDIQLDTIVIGDLTDLLAAAKEYGITLHITEGYISPEEQSALHTAEVDRLIASGYSRSQAESIAETTVPSAYHADQQTGLSLRFDIENDTKAQTWLERNSFKYGFILRYPDSKTDTTAHSADITLFRYVGKNYALQMRTLSMCLEEYIIYLNRR